MNCGKKRLEIICFCESASLADSDFSMENSASEATWIENMYWTVSSKTLSIKFA